MASLSEAEQRRRLEDAAPLFEATCTRCRALVPALESWGWRARLRSLSAVAREVLRTEVLVEQALRRATRRASVEQWPAGKVRQLYRVGQSARHAPLPERLADFFSSSRGQ